MSDRPDVESYQERAARRAAAVLLVAVMFIVGVIVFWPAPPAESAQASLADFLNAAHARGLPRWISFTLIENLSNVAMFVPLGLLGALALRQRQWLVAPAAALASAGIELGQLLLLPDRIASVEDIAANSAGALLGLLIALPTVSRRRRRQRRALDGRRGAADPPRRPIEQLR